MSRRGNDEREKTWRPPETTGVSMDDYSIRTVTGRKLRPLGLDNELFWLDKWELSHEHGH